MIRPSGLGCKRELNVAGRIRERRSRLRGAGIRLPTRRERNEPRGFRIACQVVPLALEVVLEPAKNQAFGVK